MSRARSLGDGSSIRKDWRGAHREFLPHWLGKGRERKGSGCRVTRARSRGLDVRGAGSRIANRDLHENIGVGRGRS